MESDDDAGHPQSFSKYTFCWFKQQWFFICISTKKLVFTNIHFSSGRFNSESRSLRGTLTLLRIKQTMVHVQYRYRCVMVTRKHCCAGGTFLLVFRTGPQSKKPRIETKKKTNSKVQRSICEKVIRRNG